MWKRSLGLLQKKFNHLFRWLELLLGNYAKPSDNGRKQSSFRTHRVVHGTGPKYEPGPLHILVSTFSVGYTTVLDKVSNLSVYNCGRYTVFTKILGLIRPLYVCHRNKSN